MRTEPEIITPRMKPVPVGEARLVLVTAYKTIRVTPRMLAGALWTDGRVMPADVAWAADVVTRLEEDAS
jgi:hypothetical protein